MHRAGRVAGVLREVLRGRRDQLAGEGRAESGRGRPWTSQPALFQQLARPLVAAEFDADIVEQRLGIGLDDLERFERQHLGDRDVALDEGDGGGGTLQPRRTARLAGRADLR